MDPEREPLQEDDDLPKLAVAEGVGTAPDLDAARTLLRDIFDSIHLVEISGERQLLTLLREDALGADGLPRPVELAEASERDGLPS